MKKIAAMLVIIIGGNIASNAIFDLTTAESILVGIILVLICVMVHHYE